MFKNVWKEVKSKDFNKVEDKIEKNDVGKSVEIFKVVFYIEKVIFLKKVIEKLKFFVEDLF